MGLGEGMERNQADIPQGNGKHKSNTNKASCRHKKHESW